MNTGKVMSMVIAGAAVGGAIGYLFLTASGKETLKKITDDPSGYGNKLKDGVGNFLTGLMEKFNVNKETLADGAKEIMNRTAEKATSTV